MKKQNGSNGIRLMLALTLLLALVLGFCNAWLANLNQDEGWYLHSAQLVARGELPYRDFAFTQAPLMPFAYLGALPFVEQWGVLGGRFYTMLLGLSAAGIAAWAAARMTDSEKGTAALLTFMLLTLNCYHSQYTTLVKTYALCSLLLSGGVLFSTWSGTRHGRLASLLAGVLLALAAGTRISALLFIPVVFIWLLIGSRRGRSVYECLSFAAGAAITLALLFLPFMLAAPDNFRFFNIGYHSSREMAGGMKQLVYKAGFLSRWAGAYTVAFFLAIALMIRRLVRRKSPNRRRLPRGQVDSRGTTWLWIGAAAISLVHIMAPFPYEDYQAAVFPLFAIAIAVGTVRMAFEAIRGKAGMKYFLWGMLAISTVAAFSSPVNQEWFLLGRDRIWWRLKEQPDIVKLQRVGKWLRDESGRRTELLTLDPYLAVESGLRIPNGLAMGPFSYYPELSTAAARKLNVCNREIMEEILRSAEANVAAFSEYSFAIASPGIIPVPEQERRQLFSVLEENYERVGGVENFGQAHTLLKLYRLREDGDSGLLK